MTTNEGVSRSNQKHKRFFCFVKIASAVGANMILTGGSQEKLKAFNSHKFNYPFQVR